MTSPRLSRVLALAARTIPALLVTLLLAGAAMPAMRAGSVVSVSAGEGHSCAVMQDGKAFCWGWNLRGPLGNGKSETEKRDWKPVPVSGGLSFANISAGEGFTCGVTRDHKAYCWGRGTEGQLGMGKTTPRQTKPVEVAGKLSFDTVAAGREHACGLASGGKAYCWGTSRTGQTGTGTEGVSLVPVEVAGGLGFRSISVTRSTTCGVTLDGEAYCWGDGKVPGIKEKAPIPTAVTIDEALTSVSAGMTATCAVAEGGVGHCWGAGLSKIADETTGRLKTPLRFRALSAGYGFICGLSVEGVALCWGDDTDGVLGNPGTKFRADALMPVAGERRFTSLSSYYSTTCGVTTDGDAYCWGSNRNGQAGGGEGFGAAEPKRVAFP